MLFQLNVENRKTSFSKKYRRGMHVIVCLLNDLNDFVHNLSILISEENSHGMSLIKWHNQKLKHIQTNGLQLSYSRLGTYIFLCRKWEVKSGF